jgi:hypothetical protein
MGVFTLLYLSLSVYFTNWSIINQTFWGNYPLSYKIKLFSALLEGLSMAMSPISFYSLTIVSFLTGANLALLIIILRRRVLPQANLALGIGSLLGFAGTGCASCGLPLLGLLGLTSSLFHLPLKGLEISILSIGLLLFSFLYLFRTAQQICAVKLRKNGHSPN